MKLLIITSEKLNPENIITSIFELTQASILSTIFEVAIIAVELEFSLLSMIKGEVKHALRFIRPYPKGIKKEGPSIWKMAQVLVLGQKITNNYSIDGISVIEGNGFFWRNPKSFSEGLAAWTKSGMTAFEVYRKKYGLPDIVHAHGRFLNAGALALEIKKKYGIKYLYTEHSTYFQRGMVPTEAIPVCKEIISGASAYAVVSVSLLQQVEKVLDLKIPQARIVPNALDSIFEKPLKDRPGGKDFVFTVVASIEHKKGIDVLIAAFAKVKLQSPAVRLNIVGDGPLKSSIAKLISSNGLANEVHLLGIKTKEEIVQLLDEDSHAFVLPSREETFGVVLIEALSRGLPVIATRSGGPEFFVNDTCGLLVERDNVDALAAAMIDMIDGYSRFDREAIRRYALSKFGSDSFRETMGKIYKEIEMTNA